MRRYTVIFTPRAERHLESLYAYIATHGGEQRADNYVSRIVTECLSLATFPERGTQRDDVRPNLRIMGFARRVTIAFSINVTTSTVAIHGVFYGGQDFGSTLRDDDSDA
jgi:toxin ParE1/3/4